MSRSSSELKRISRDILNNRYSVPMAAFLTASLIPTLIEIPFSMTLGDYPGTPQLIISTIADILILLIAQMLDTGVMLVHMNMTRGQTYRIRDVFTPFRNGAERFFLAAVLFDVFLVIAGIPAIAGVLYFYKTGVSGLSGALLAAGSILGLIFTFYVLLTYRMVFFFLLDHPHLSVRDAFRTCREFMRGRRRKLLYILFSFLGWSALAICSFGIAALWISPYMTQTLLTFYLDGTGELDQIPVRDYDQETRRFTGSIFDILWQIRSSDLPFVYTQLSIISHQEEFTMNEKDGAIRDASVLGVPKNADSWPAAYVCHVRRNHSRADSGQQLLRRRCSTCTGYIDLCRYRNFIFPSMFQIQGSGVSRFFLCLPRRFCHDCKHGFRCIRRHVQR